MADVSQKPTHNPAQPPTRDVNQERARLIDHFKRAYQVIVGVAITVACSKLFPGGWQSVDITFWTFCTFFITVVPIFHGGDRSLDLKYLGTSSTDSGVEQPIFGMSMSCDHGSHFCQNRTGYPRTRLIWLWWRPATDGAPALLRVDGHNAYV
jgi:hypothetical protein